MLQHKRLSLSSKATTLLKGAVALSLTTPVAATHSDDGSLEFDKVKLVLSVVLLLGIIMAVLCCWDYSEETAQDRQQGVA